MWKAKSTGPFFEDRNHRWVNYEHPNTDPKKLLIGIAAVCGAGASLWGFFKIRGFNRKDRPFTLNAEATKARKAHEITMGWWQEQYWKKGDPIYLPKPSQSDWFGDSEADWPVERSLAFLDDDEWWENFEQSKPTGWINILPEAFKIFQVKKKSVEGGDEAEEEEEDEEGEEEEEKESHLILPYNAFNPTALIPSDRPEYRRVLEVIHEGHPRKSREVDAPYNNVLAGCTAIIDPDGPKPVKVTFSNDWRDLSPELLQLIRERLIWKYKDDWENYAPQEFAKALKEKWEEHLVQVQQK